MVLKKIMAILLVTTFYLYSMDATFEKKLTEACTKLIRAKQQAPRDNKKIEKVTDEINGYVGQLMAQGQFTQELRYTIAYIMSL